VPPFPAALLAALARQGYTVVRITLRGVPVWLIVPARAGG
jgi:antitoxin (DNA-binding transcriptional repressor) of toxin-antitoxin stability system